MKVLVIGLGLVGKELAGQLRAKGHTVVGTTTTPERVDALRPVVEEVLVLRGADVEAVANAMARVDAVAVCAGPNAARAMTREDRAASYHEILVCTAEAVTAAPFTGPIAALSSLSVYGSAADHCAAITEDAPLSQADDPSPQMFQAMERVYQDKAGEHACVFRCADIYGNADPPMEQKVEMAHTMLGGSVPFLASALMYRVDVRDVARAVRYGLDHRLTGLYNLTHADVPPTLAACFDPIGASKGYGPLTFRGELAGPGAPVSIDRLMSTGFRLAHTKAEQARESV